MGFVRKLSCLGCLTELLLCRNVVSWGINSLKAVLPAAIEKWLLTPIYSIQSWLYIWEAAFSADSSGFILGESDGKKGWNIYCCSMWNNLNLKDFYQFFSNSFWLNSFKIKLFAQLIFLIHHPSWDRSSKPFTKSRQTYLPSASIIKPVNTQKIWLFRGDSDGYNLDTREVTERIRLMLGANLNPEFHSWMWVGGAVLLVSFKTVAEAHFICIGKRARKSSLLLMWHCHQNLFLFWRKNWNGEDA